MKGNTKEEEGLKNIERQTHFKFLEKKTTIPYLILTLLNAFSLFRDETAGSPSTLRYQMVYRKYWPLIIKRWNKTNCRVNFIINKKCRQFSNGYQIWKPTQIKKTWHPTVANLYTVFSFVQRKKYTWLLTHVEARMYSALCHAFMKLIYFK